MTRALHELEAWFVTGSQPWYGDDVLRRVDEHASRIVACLDTPAVSDLAGRVAVVEDSTVDTLVEQYEELYDVAPALRSSGERHDELVEIDGDTRTAAFKRELRWNNAYYFIDRGG